MTDYLTSPIPVLYPKGYMPMMYLKILEKHLCVVNPVYEECLDTNEIAHGILYLQQMQTHALWRDVKVHKGTSLNQVKPVRVLDTPMKKKFFYGLLEE